MGPTLLGYRVVEDSFSQTGVLGGWRGKSSPSLIWFERSRPEPSSPFVSGRTKSWSRRGCESLSLGRRTGHTPVGQ